MDEPFSSSRGRAQARTRSALLKSARRLVAARGAGSVSVADIANDAGFTKGAFYSNFASREAMFLALGKMALEDRLATLEPLVDIAAGQGIEKALDRYAEIAAAHAEELHSLGVIAEVQLQVAREPGPQGTMQQHFQDLFDKFEAILVELSKLAAHPLPMPPEEAALLILAATQGLAQQPIQPSTARSVMRNLLKLIFDGRPKPAAA